MLKRKKVYRNLKIFYLQKSFGRRERNNVDRKK